MEQEEPPDNARLGSPLRPLLTYGLPIVGAGVWAFSKFPDRLRWTSELFARAFGLTAPFYEDLTRIEGYGEALDAAVDALDNRPTRVLDVGCGTGYAARRVSHAFPDAEVVGVDLSPEMVLIARREADEEGLDIEFEVGDAADLEFEDESFDLVVSHNSPPYPAEMMRVLRPAGTALTVWSFGGPWVALAWPALAKELKKHKTLHADGHRAGPGFYGIAEKSGIRRRRRPRPEAAAPPPPPPPPVRAAPTRSATGQSRSAANRAAASRVAKPAATAAPPSPAGESEPAPKPATSRRPAAPRSRTPKPKAAPDDPTGHITVAGARAPGRQPRRGASS